MIFILTLFFLFIFSKSPSQTDQVRERIWASEKINIKIYENEIEMEIVSPNMEYKSDNYYNREWKESLINEGFCEF